MDGGLTAQTNFLRHAPERLSLSGRRAAEPLDFQTQEGQAGSLSYIKQLRD